MEYYTLNNFYFQTKELIKEYSLQGSRRMKYKLTVEFKIRQYGNKEPNLDCTIHYEPQDSKYPSYCGYGCTPVICIQSFEAALQKAAGIQILDNLAIELT